jgi:hypothetical protein
MLMESYLTSRSHRVFQKAGYFPHMSCPRRINTDRPPRVAAGLRKYAAMLAISRTQDALLAVISLFMVVSGSACKEVIGYKVSYFMSEPLASG